MRGIVTVVFASALACGVAGSAAAQLSGATRDEFVGASVKSCSDTVAANHPEFPASVTNTFCTCMAEGEADITTADDVQYLAANHAPTDDYRERVKKLAPYCNAKAGLH